MVRSESGPGHGLLFHRCGQLRNGATKSCARHGGSSVHDRLENIVAKLFGGFPEHSAVPFLDEMFGVEKKRLGSAEDVVVIRGSPRRHNQRDSRRSPEPNVS